MPRYFAYGSNMNQDDLNRYFRKYYHYTWTRRQAQLAELENYKLDFNFSSGAGKGGAANIMKSPGDSVFGLIFEVDEQEYKVLSRKEGDPDFYQEIDIDVVVDARLERVKTFKVSQKNEREFQQPAKEYMTIIIEAAEKHDFPEWYLKRLRSVPVES